MRGKRPETFAELRVRDNLTTCYRMRGTHAQKRLLNCGCAIESPLAIKLLTAITQFIVFLCILEDIFGLLDYSWIVTV